MSRVAAWLPVFTCGCLLIGSTAQAADSATDGQTLADRASLRVASAHHSAAATSITATRDGATIITGSEDRTIRIWDARSGALLRTLRPPSLPVGDEGRIYAVALSPDERLVAAGGITRFFDERKQRGSAVYLFDISSGALVRRLIGSDSNLSHRIDRILFSKDGKRLAVRRTRERTFGLYDFASGAPIDQAIDYSGMVYLDADFDDAGTLLLTRRSAIQLHDGALKKIAEVGGLPPLVRARFLPGGKQIVAIYEDGRIELRRRLANKIGPPVAIGTAMPKIVNVTAVAFDRDGKTLYVAAQLEGSQVPVVRRLPLGKELVARDHELPYASINDLAPLPNGALAFAAGDGSWGILEADGAHRYGISPVWSALPDALRVDQTGEEIELRLGMHSNDWLRFSVSALELRSAKIEEPRLRAPFIEPKSPHHITGWQHSGPVYLDAAGIISRADDPSALAVSPNKESFLIGTAQKLYGYRFDRAQPDTCPHPPAPKDQSPAPCFDRQVPSAVQAVNYSGDGRYAVALLTDGTVRWYDARDGSERLALLLQPTDGRWLLFRPDGLYAASPSGAELGGWQINDFVDRGPDFFPLSRFKQRFERPEEVAATLRESGTSGSARAAFAPSLTRDQLPPVLTILEPADGTLVNNPAVTLKIATHSLSGQPATGLRVRIDGRPVAVAQSRGIVDLGAKEPVAPAVNSGSEKATPQSISITIPERDCVVAVFAEDSAGAGPPALLRLRWSGKPGPTATKPALSPPPQPTGSLRVLAIGVDEYQRADLRLRYPGKDARDLAAIIKQSQGGKPGAARLYQSVDVRVLTGRDATKAGILEALDWLQHRATTADTTILFLAGHGTNETTTGEYYFLPADADPSSALRTMLPASTLQQVLSAVPGRIVLLLDTCHSGNVLGNSGRRTRGLPALSRAIAELSGVDSGVVVMAAATGDQASIEDTQWQNGAFAKAIIEGLSGNADERHTGRVTVNMLDLYVSERVRELTGGVQTPATAKPSTIADFPLLLSQSLAGESIH